MRVISLQSGSNGNCIYVEAGHAKLLFDAGISGKQAEMRLRAFGRDIRQVDALLISHDHRDHIAIAGVYQRKFGLPMCVTKSTLQAGRARHDLGPLGQVRFFRVGQTLQFDGAIVHTIPTPHDAADGCCFVVEAEGKRLGILTDLGHIFEGLGEVVGSLNAVLLESNYDPEMLQHGHYPWSLKQRIAGPQGHLSNFESARLLAESGRGLAWAALGHMSQDNNSPELAYETHRAILGSKTPIHLATRYEPSACLEL
jgi:phosphoribosyl 1,2-cyclic phosphodiesterase